MKLQELLARAEGLVRDIDFTPVRRWKDAVAGRKAIGYMPVFAPREIIHAAGMLPVGVFGGGDQMEIIRGDACFQSYICHIPRSTVELALSGRLSALDGMIFPSTCDVIRNLSGMWKILLPGVYARYLDVPQNFDRAVGGRYFETELRAIAKDLARLAGREFDENALRESIRTFNANRRLTREVNRLRRESPHLAPASEVYVVLRAGCVIPVEEHNEMLAAYIEEACASGRPVLDNCRLIIRGAFCEQPPPALLRTLERAGCDIVSDDLLLVTRWFTQDVPEEGDPFEAYSWAFLESSVPTASLYIGDKEKGADLVEEVRECRAEGVIFAAASFCDPALLDQPMLADALEKASIPYTAFKFSEDTGQFQTIREQAGTFADSIKLWSTA